MNSLVTLLSSLYPVPAMHSLLVTIIKEILARALDNNDSACPSEVVVVVVFSRILSMNTFIMIVGCTIIS